MKKYLQIAILIIISFTIGFSQDNGTNQERLKKYWYLRWRLNNYFMVMGDCYGCSLPAGIRNSYSSPQFIDGEQYWSKGMDFGDAPNYLGTYIGILATEYELLNNNDESTSATLNELYYAIKAVNRLDECEAQYTWNKGANNLDGMCSRGDIDTGFVRSHYSELNMGLTFANNQVLFQGNPPQPGDPSMDVRVGSHYSYEKDPLIDKFDGMMSQDHISSILVGLALVKKFVPDNITINGMNLHDEAQHITERLIDYLQSHNWLLKDPDGEQVKLDWGGQAVLFSYGFAKAASFIWPQKTLDFFDAISLSNKPIWDAVGTAFLGATDFANWTEICDLFNEPDNCDNSGNAWIILNLAAVGNSWETVVLDFAALPGANPVFAVLGIACLLPGLDCSQGLIWAHSKIYEWEAYYPLLHATLHNSGCLTSRERIEEDLNSMPCRGHWGDNGPVGWSTQNKYHQIPSVQNTGNSGFAGQYSALEFMLLHNLYYIHGNNKDSEGNTLPAFNKMNITSVSQINCNPAPPPPNCTVSLEQPDKVYNVSQDISGTEEKHFKNSITTQSGKSIVIKSGANVWWTAGNFIELNEGFETEDGATFTAEIIECNELFGRMASDSSRNYTKANGDIAASVKNSSDPEVGSSETKSKGKSASKSENNQQPETSIQKESVIAINPNPSTDGKFNLTCTVQDVGCMKAEITVMDMLGQIIHKEPLRQYVFPLEIDLSSQPKGAYFIKIQNNETVLVYKVVAQ